MFIVAAKYAATSADNIKKNSATSKMAHHAFANLSGPDVK